jgi:SRSO17 transposase
METERNFTKSANEKSGNKSAGAGRQYNGRLGKVEMSQVGTFLSYAKVSTLLR